MVFKIGNKIMLGRHLSEETKLKIKNIALNNPNYGMRGKHHTEESNEKNRISHLGKQASNKTKEKMRLSQELRKDKNKYWLGKHFTINMKEKIGRANKGKIVTMETRKKISKTLIGHRQSKETIKKICEARKVQIFPLQDTSIEVKIQKFLKQLNISFFTHQYIKEIEHGYQCDILIPSMNLIIECDGDYWHKYPVGRDIDRIRTKELINNGYRVIRLWENEIKVMEINDLKTKLESIK